MGRLSMVNPRSSAWGMEGVLGSVSAEVSLWLCGC